MQTLVTMLLPQSNDKGLTIAGPGTKFLLRYKFARAVGVIRLLENNDVRL